MEILKDKVALVTGAAKGIGFEVAKALTQSGATVVATDFDEAGLRALPADLANKAQKLDVVDRANWTAVVERMKQDFGRLDILVNNAGIIVNKTFLDTDIAEFHAVTKVNLEGVWNGMQICAPLMRERKDSGGSSIVNMSSVYGLVGSPMNAAYSATKGAVRFLTKSVAAEFAAQRTGIRVNSVHPGPTETALLLDGFQDLVDDGTLPSMDEAKKIITRMIPMRRLGNPSEVAAAVLFLASPQSSYMTGSELIVDGGYTCI